MDVIMGDIPGLTPTPTKLPLETVPCGLQIKCFRLEAMFPRPRNR